MYERDVVDAAPEDGPTSDDEAAVVFLEEAEDALSKRDHRLVTLLLARCSSMDISDPRISVRLERLASRAQREIDLGKAERWVTLGQPDEALASLRALLDQDPDDTEVLARVDLLLRARTSQGPPEGEPPPTASTTATPRATTSVDEATPAPRASPAPDEGRSSTPDLADDDRAGWHLRELMPLPPAGDPPQAASPPLAPPPTTGPIGLLPEPEATVTVEPVARTRSVHFSELSLRIAPKPNYPDRAQAGAVGDVTCMARIAVDEGGRVTEVAVSGCPEEFQEATTIAMKRSRFAPHVLDGHAIPVATTLPVRYSLRGP
jgi:hypothetical protein